MVVTPSKEGGVTFTYSETTNDAEEVIPLLRIIDDVSVKGETLGRRRLALANDGVILQKLGKAIFFLGDLVKLATRESYFIDSNGRLFQYKKSARAKLHFRKIKNVIPIPTGGALLDVEGIPSRLKCLFAPKRTELYAGVLEWAKSHILYGLYEQEYKSSWRMI